MTEQEQANRLKAIDRVLTASINRLAAGGTSDIDSRIQELFAAYDEGVKAGEARGRAGANKTVAESLASVIALRAIVDQCRAAGFINDAGAVRKVLERTEYVDGVTWGLKPGESMLILEAANAARKAVKP